MSKFKIIIDRLTVQIKIALTELNNEIVKLKVFWANSTSKAKMSMIFLLGMYILPIISNFILAALFAVNIDSIKGLDQTTLIYIGILVFCTSTFSIISTTLLSIACGYLFGWSCFPILLAMFTVSSLVGYYLANLFDQQTIMSWIGANEVAYQFIEKLKKRLNFMVFVMRVTPILPFTVTNVLCSYLSVPLKNYLGMSFIGIGARLAIAVYTGTQINSFVTMEDDPIYKYQKYALWIGSFLLFGILYYLVMKEKDKALNA
ncbi:VTT domain-containing protein [Cytophaga aurantiaca]|uniref:VTT domain-containing protein n=1 Tax=Cytophaga aurantiaca TaxID=29530 RepID=UPI00037651AC|nr:VTT domain-containing protein [Cytophaga aurantiaca]